MYKILSQFEREVILSQHAVEKNKVVADRLKVVLLRDDGWTMEKIAEVLFIGKDTASIHLQQYAEGKLSKESGGSSCKLNLKQTEELTELIKHNLYSEVGQIINLCFEKFGIKYSRTGMTDLLHRLNFKYVKPTQILPKVDIEKQIEYIKIYDKIKEIAELNKEILLHLDSIHSTMNNKFTHAWIHKDNPIFVNTNNSYTRVNTTGAVNLKTMKLIAHSFDKINQDSFVDYLKIVKSNYPNKVINIVLDNGRYHKTQKVSEYCKNNNIKLHFLPPYSPNLNPIERLWKVMNKHVRNNIFYTKPDDFRKAIEDFFKLTWPTIKNKSRSIINDNFHIINPI